MSAMWSKTSAMRAFSMTAPFRRYFTKRGGRAAAPEILPDGRAARQRTPSAGGAAAEKPGAAAEKTVDAPARPGRIGPAPASVTSQ